MKTKIYHKFKSKNFSNDRKEIKFIVIHTTELNFKDSLDILCNENSNSRVSSHYLIDRNGDIYNLVSEDKTAWHAGISHWQGIDNINPYSIGIEIVCKPEPEQDITEQQYKSLIYICKDIIKKHKITNPDNIVAHSDIAIGRKIDPGKRFDWSLLEKNDIGRIHEFNLNKVNKDNNKQDLINKLKEIGYDTKNHNLDDVLKAFALHHRLIE